SQGDENNAESKDKKDGVQHHPAHQLSFVRLKLLDAYSRNERHVAGHQRQDARRQERNHARKKRGYRKRQSGHRLYFTRRGDVSGPIRKMLLTAGMLQSLLHWLPDPARYLFRAWLVLARLRRRHRRRRWRLGRSRSQLRRWFRQDLADEPGRQHRSQHRTAVVLRYFQAVEELLDIGVPAAARRRQLGTLKDIKDGGSLGSHAFGIIFGIGNRLRTKVKGAQISRGQNQGRRLLKQQRPDSIRERKAGVTARYTDDGPSQAHQGHILLVVAQKRGSGKRGCQLP